MEPGHGLEELASSASGVLPNQYLARAVASGMISAGDCPVPEDNIQPASLDLRLGEVAYRIRCSFLPHDEPVERKVEDHIVDELDLRGDGAVLETNRPYLIPLVERLSLPSYLRGRANPKSSTGRLDVFTRVITDGSHRFDEIGAGYHGRLYLEVVPLSFAVRVRKGLALNQLRLIAGISQLSDDELWEEHRHVPLLFVDGLPASREQFATSRGLFLSLDLRRRDGTSAGFRARSNTTLLDMARAGAHRVEDFWESVPVEHGDRVVLEPEKFYLLLSHESICVPPHLASEMTAFDPTSGELRTHYAGFFDPGFGYDRTGGIRGSKAALEVRAHDVPFMIENGQRVCKLTFERMIAEPTRLYGSEIGSNYQGQTVTLGKHFRVDDPRS